MKAIARFKAKGPGRGWWGPPKGTHGTEEGRGKREIRPGKAPNDSDRYGRTPEAEEYMQKGLGKSWMEASDEERQAVKHQVISGLLQEAGIEYPAPEGAPDAELEKTGQSYWDANQGIKQWAYTSGDNDARSLAIQEDASKEFGIKLDAYTEERVENAKVHAKVRRITVASERPLDYPEYPGGQRAFLRNMYNRTQRELEDAGIETVRLYRGFKTGSVEAATMFRKAGKVTVIGSPLQSWSLSYEVAEYFSGRQDGVVFQMDVPRSLIMGTARTGFGCLAEGEFIVLGHPDNEARVVD